ncbi:MAG: hypothetical protein EA338_04955 [Roseinatronobacter sp.]|nr:MAG: hypothetical protein EA338_04955 [Roseinatronobacter sp.]
MVTKKETVKDRWDIPRVRIESRELLEIIKSLSESTGIDVVAETKSHKFKGITDIEENIELFKGDVEIKIGAIRINLTEGFMRGVSARWGTLESETECAQTIAERFITKISAYKVYFSYNLKRGITGLISAFAFSYYLMLPPMKVALPTFADHTLLIGSTLVYWSVAHSLLGYIFKKNGPVYFSARDSFWSRNSDKILVGFLILIAGIAIATFIEFISF